MKIALLFLLSTITIFGETYEIAFPIQDFYPQYHVTYQSKKGLLVEILKKFSKDESIKINLEGYPVSRYLEMFKNGQVDFLFPDNPHWKKSPQTGKVVFSDPVIKSKVVFFTSHKDLRQKDVKSIATIEGYVVSPLKERIESKDLRDLKITYIHKVDSLLQFVSKKRADIGFFHKDIIERVLKEKNIPIKILPSYPQTSYTYHLSTIKHPKVILRFNSWLKENQTWIDQRKKDLYISDIILSPFPVLSDHQNIQIKL